MTLGVHFDFQTSCSADISLAENCEAFAGMSHSGKQRRHAQNVDCLALQCLSIIIVVIKMSSQILKATMLFECHAV